MVKEIARNADHGTSIGIETTLPGSTYARMIHGWRNNGYTVKLIFLSLGSVDEAIARVAIRVRLGGHNVPEDTIRRRFDAGWLNFHSVCRSCVDSWLLFDNGGEYPLLLEEGENT